MGEGGGSKLICQMARCTCAKLAVALYISAPSLGFTANHIIINLQPPPAHPLPALCCTFVLPVLKPLYDGGTYAELR